MGGGRKREFDENAALEAAMQVFWQKGFAGASLSELTESMGINKPSMYSAFGNKEALFVKTTQLYLDSVAQLISEILHAPDVPLAERIRNYMMLLISKQCESDPPKGCYVVLCESEVAGGDLPPEAARMLTEAGHSAQEIFAELFRNDPEAKTLKLNENAEGKALCLATTLRGTASMARTGISESELVYVVEQSLKGVGIK